MMGSGDLSGVSGSKWYRYPKSGVSIEYNEFDKVEGLHFVGNLRQPDWVRYDGKIVFGIHLDMKLDDLTRILGEPIHITGQELESGELFWKKDGILIEGEIWNESLEEVSGKVEKHTIRFMTLKRGI